MRVEMHPSDSCATLGRVCNAALPCCVGLSCSVPTGQQDGTCTA
jgi:hypothetical protein